MNCHNAIQIDGGFKKTCNCGYSEKDYKQFDKKLIFNLQCPVCCGMVYYPSKKYFCKILNSDCLTYDCELFI